VDQIRDAMDLRRAFHPKAPLPSAVSAAGHYPQVFQERHGYCPRTSAIDLVCNTGPTAREIIRRLG
jgi:hypothetical protein